MSLRSMAVMRAQAEAAEAAAHTRRERRPGGRIRESAEEGDPSGGGTPPAADDSQTSGARDQLIALIPAEAVALFILLIGLAAEESLGVRIGAVVLVALLAVGWTVLSYYEAREGRVGAGWPRFEVVVGTVAFLAWTTSVPASPFFDLDWPSWVGPAIVAVVSALLVAAVRARAVWAKQANPIVTPQERVRTPAG